MTAPLRTALLLFSLTACLCAQNTVGGGAPNAPVTNAFQQAFFQNGFNLLVNPVPSINVSTLGATGYYQEFTSLTTSTNKLALILPSIADVSNGTGVSQMLSPLYTYYISVTEALVGYPTINTALCPGNSSCQYQTFTNNYSLFYYSSGNPNGSGFSTSGAVNTLWNSLGGPYSALGMAYSGLAAVASPAKTTANAQQFTSGIVVTVTSGLNSGSTFSVVEPIWDLYNAYSGPAGALGLPTSNDLTLADGSHRQTFEAGRVVYTAGNTPTVLLPVSEISISPPGAATLQFGQTLTASVSLFDSAGIPAVGRTVSWSTSDSSAVSITPNGYSAVLKGVGSGIAVITATSEGIVGKSLVVTAVEPCCQIGQGAPTAAIQAAFQAAVTRNNITVLVPAANPVRRLGTGYVQDLYSTNGAIHYLVGESDLNSQAYVVTGPLLTAYTAAGGPAGPLAYASSDSNANGTQLFEGGALAGNPVQTVTGAVLKKWALTGYESGALGVPTAAESPFTSISGYTGYSQAFAGGTIFGISNGSLSGQGFLSAGLVLARYLALFGPAGEMGVPLADPFTTAGVVRQNFENGYIDLQPNAAAAVEHLNPRTPAVTVTPATVLPGNRLHIALTGFNNNATLRVSQTSQADFLVTAPAGAYQWDTYIPAAATAGTVIVKAVDSASSTSTASGTYTIRSLAAASPQIAKYQGDNQTGAPGATLSTPLAITLTDSSSAPLPGVSVTFSPSPGASVSPSTSVTDANGRAATSLRLPVAPGIAAVTAQAAGKVVIFDAQATGSYALSNYPQFVSTSTTGTEVAAVASMVFYYQNSGLMPAANGQATPVTLDQFLRSLSDGYLTSSGLVNLWRLVNFTGSTLYVSSEASDLVTIRTLTAGGDPVLLALALTQDGVAAGGTTVVATGIASDGSVVILDPTPALARLNLNDYLNGFNSGGHAYRATILSALRLLPKAPPAAGFVLASESQPVATLSAVIQSASASSCAVPLAFQDPGTPVLVSQLVFCDGTQSVYQAAVTSAGSLIDLAAAPGTGTSALTGNTTYQVVQTAGRWTPSPATISFTASSVLNAATFQPGISPGGIFSLFGAGLAAPTSGNATTVSVGGQSAQVLLATPFQINAQVPPAAAPGTTAIQITSPFGSASQTVPVQTASPGIFVVGLSSDGVSSLGAVVNQNGVLNGPTSPATRGTTVTIYCTGLGSTTNKNGLSVANATVTAVLSGTSLPVAFSGLTPGFVGLYQVNVPIPAATPPGLLISLALQVSAVTSNTVVIAVQ